MDSNGRTQPLLVGFLIIPVIVCLDFELVLSLQSNAYLTERVTFYPASLIVSHNPKPWTFYENTKPLNVHIVLNFTDFGERLCMSNHLCSLHDGRFFSMRYFTQFVIFKRLCTSFYHFKVSPISWSAIHTCQDTTSLWRVNPHVCFVPVFFAAWFQNARHGLETLAAPSRAMNRNGWTLILDPKDPIGCVTQDYLAYFVQFRNLQVIGAGRTMFLT